MIGKILNTFIFSIVLITNLFGGGDDGNDLQWLVFENDGYRSYSPLEDVGIKTISFWLETSRYESMSLSIKSYYQPRIFIDGELVGQLNQINMDFAIDSLRRLARKSSFLVTIYQQNINEATLQTEITGKEISETGDFINYPKPPTYFRDFVITGFVIMLSIFVFVKRVNSKLTSDYFSFMRIFTTHDSEDMQLHGRVRYSTNILFYAFCSLIISFYLIVIFRFVPDRFALAWPFQADSFFMALVQWLKLAGIIFSLFISKFFLVFIATKVFDLKEILGVHIFNWVRMMLVSLGFMTLILMTYYVSHGINENVYAGMFKIIAWIFVAWIIILFPKVVRRSQFSMFHIFSYLCATEIIPLLVSIKFLYH